MKNKKTLRIVLFFVVVVAILATANIANPNHRNTASYEKGYTAGSMIRHYLMVLASVGFK
ncbi:hypothetical protein [Microbacter margulisiae]|uniref:Uncharacterized protein n=1 Tax=Microbacter margulisiae TaxID=1350067 RepID=A0A7W5H2Z6_9PORP|nr:hypothetical protein [Microbacter margulisiae]MBB3187892.1 hypothetical protein [Microbacter margulisiae]